MTSSLPSICLTYADAWEQRKLGKVTDSYSGGTPSAGRKDYYGGSIPFIRSAEINSSKTELFLTELGFNSSSAAMVNVGDILYALYGATSGEVGISQIKGAINQAILAILPHEGYDSYFITSWLRKNKEGITGEYLQGGQGNLSGAIVKSLEIMFPSGKEQALIGSFFKKMDDSITLHQRVHFGITINHLKNPNAWEQHELWKLTIWDKKFNEVDKEKQPKTRKYRYALADAINLIIIPGGDIKILSTGSLDAYTTKERAGEYLCNGEIVAIPWGGTPNIKYAKGFFVTGDNRIATSNDLDKLNNRYLYWWFNTPLKHLENIYRGASIKHPSMNDVLNMTIQLPSIPEQKKIIGLLDNIDSLLTFISKCSFTYIIKIFEFTYTIERSLFCFTTFHIIISVSLISKIAMFLFLLIQKQPLGIMFFYI